MSEPDNHESPTYPPEFVDLTPSAQLLFVLIRLHGPVTQPELRDRTGLSEWTVSTCTQALEEHGLIDRSPMEQNPNTVVCELSRPREYHK